MTGCATDSPIYVEESQIKLVTKTRQKNFLNEMTPKGGFSHLRPLD